MLDQVAVGDKPIKHLIRDQKDIMNDTLTHCLSLKPITCAASCFNFNSLKVLAANPTAARNCTVTRGGRG